MVLTDGILQILEEWLPRLWLDHSPQLAIFQAGVDALKEDAYGRSAPASFTLRAFQTDAPQFQLQCGVPKRVERVCQKRLRPCLLEV